MAANVFWSNDEYDIRQQRALPDTKISGGVTCWSSDGRVIRPFSNFDDQLTVAAKDRGYYDLETFMNPSVGSGMILLIEKATGKPCGHVAAVINANSTGWISMFIISPAHRGKGLGRELFKAAIADFGRCGTELEV